MRFEKLYRNHLVTKLVNWLDVPLAKFQVLERDAENCSEEEA